MIFVYITLTSVFFFAFSLIGIFLLRKKLGVKEKWKSFFLKNYIDRTFFFALWWTFVFSGYNMLGGVL